MPDQVNESNVIIGGEEWAAEPESVLKGLRESGKVHRVTLPDGMPTWLVTGYEESRAALSDPRLCKRTAVAAPELQKHLGWASEEFALNRHMLLSDPPEHTRLRRLVSKAFTARRVETLRPKIQQITDDLLDGIAQRNEADIVADLASPLPMAVTCFMLGIPSADTEAFQHYSDVIIGTSASSTGDDVLGAGQWFDSYLADLVARRRDDLGDDLVSGLIAAQEHDDRLTDTEVRSTAFLMLVAGVETTVNLIGNGVLTLTRHPELTDKLAADPEITPAFVEEVLRLESPVTTIPYRFATQDMMIGDIKIARGENVMVAVASANHDEGRFSEPDRLRLERGEASHITFGQGVHFCLGAPLARLEGKIALGSLVQRLGNLRLTVPYSQLAWRPSFTMHGVNRLPVAYTVR